MESHRFEADVRQILNLVTHSLYSDREIFLRELVSNASDALDRARFEGLQRDDLRAVDGEPRIRITVDEAEGTITIEDDGIGLSADEAREHLGTIAQSGTKAFANALKDKGEDVDGLVGQFGVGFYSAFMVADKVVVESLSALPDSEPMRWTCDGSDSYSVEPCERDKRGTSITLHVKEDAKDFVDVDRLRHIVRTHSDYIPWPVLVGDERANQEEALWRRNPADVSEDEYNAFYRHVSHDWEDPALHIHIRADAPLQFQAVLFLPKKRPWELDRLDYKVGLQLYQKRVKILDHADALLPRYLRFVRGVVDSPDVDLNMSREILQQTPVIQAIKGQLIRKLLKELKTLSEKDGEAYSAFWKEFGHILKEGVHEDHSQKDKLVKLLRYRSTTSGGDLRSLSQLLADMKEGQEALWYLTDVDKEHIDRNPSLESFKKRGWEVLLMDDPVDEWVAMQVREFEGKELKSVTRGDVPQVEDDPVAQAAKEQAQPLAGWMSTLLGDDVACVRLSNRLTDSPSVLVDQEGALGANMERILKAANQEITGSKRVLELNPEHSLVKTLARLQGEKKEGLEPFARLLLDHAYIAEGRLEDPTGFAGRLQALMEKASSAL